MAYVIEIDGVDRTSLILRSSIDFRTNKSGVSDDFGFSITFKKPDDNFGLVNGLEVSFFEDGIKVFGGEILQKAVAHSSAELGVWRVTCTDYTRRISKGEPIAEIYRDMTVREIIVDIHSRYEQANEFNIDNVNCDIIVDYCFFGHLKFPDVLRELADRTAYEFYIDPEKKIYFFESGSIQAPFSIDDKNGQWRRNTLSFSEKADRIVNWILVEGDEYTSSETFTETFPADGVKEEYKISNRYAGVDVSVNGIDQSVGAFGLSDPNDYDLLYDFNGGTLVFRADTKPVNGLVIAVSGQRKIPVLAQVIESTSISQYGILPKHIVNNSIKTIESAKQYAMAEIQRYSKEAFAGKFVTRLSGLRAGQRLSITDSVLGLTKSMTIQGTSTRVIGDDIFETTVSVSSSEVIDAIAVLARLLHSKNTSATAQKTLKVFRQVLEEIEVKEEVFTNRNVQTVSESLHLLEKTKVTENATIEYVICDHVQQGLNDPKRRFIICGSPISCT